MKTQKKYGRKFTAWLVATLALAVLVIMCIVVRLPEYAQVLIAFIPWWGGVTLLYLGVEGGADIVSRYKSHAPPPDKEDKE
jgi:hypothetical protein